MFKNSITRLIMPNLKIVIAPDPILESKSSIVKIENMTKEKQNFIDDMISTMYEDGAVGFASVQFGVPEQIIVIDLGDHEDQERPKDFYPLVIINPKVRFLSEEMIVASEGCMSIPNIRIDVPRPKYIELEFVDRNFEPQTIKTDGWLARVIQHEIDHIHGKTLLDHMSKLKKDISINKLEKFKKYLV